MPVHAWCRPCHASPRVPPCCAVLQAMAARKEREAAIAKAQMDAALSGGASWGMQEDAFDIDEEGECSTARTAQLLPCRLGWGYTAIGAATPHSSVAGLLTRNVLTEQHASWLPLAHNSCFTVVHHGPHRGGRQQTKHSQVCFRYPPPHALIPGEDAD